LKQVSVLGRGAQLSRNPRGYAAIYDSKGTGSRKRTSPHLNSVDKLRRRLHQWIRNPQRPLRWTPLPQRQRRHVPRQKLGSYL